MIRVCFKQLGTLWRLWIKLVNLLVIVIIHLGTGESKDWSLRVNHPLSTETVLKREIRIVIPNSKSPTPALWSIPNVGSLVKFQCQYSSQFPMLALQNRSQCLLPGQFPMLAFQSKIPKLAFISNPNISSLVNSQYQLFSQHQQMQFINLYWSPLHNALGYNCTIGWYKQQCF